MRYVAAYLLTALGSKDTPTVADIEKILSSVGIESDTHKIKKVIEELGGKNIEELINKGKEKLASIPSGGGAAPAAAAGAAAAAAAAPAAGSPAKKEEKKEAKKEEPEESDDDMGFGLFD